MKSEWRHVEVSGGQLDREAFEPGIVVVKMEAGLHVDVFVLVAREEVFD